MQTRQVSEKEILEGIDARRAAKKQAADAYAKHVSGDKPDPRFEEIEVQVSKDFVRNGEHYTVNMEPKPKFTRLVAEDLKAQGLVGTKSDGKGFGGTDVVPGVIKEAKYLDNAATAGEKK